MPETRRPDRYEPMPPLPQLPGWLWARMGTAARGLVVIAAVALVAVTVVMVPRLTQINRDNRAADRRDAARATADRVRAIRELQRPHTVVVSGRSRAALRRSLSTAILADSRARPRPNPVRRVECDGPPGTPRPEADEGVRRGRYSCTAVTSHVANVGESGTGEIGYPYRAVIDFPTGRITLCRVAGQPGEGSLVTQGIAIPAACGG